MFGNIQEKQAEMQKKLATIVVEAEAGDGAVKITANASRQITDIKINPDFYRPAESGNLYGDPSKALRELGWAPEMPFDRLVTLMTEADLELVGRQSGALNG